MEKVWYVKSSLKKGGPFTEDDFIKLIKHEIIDDSYEIWMLEMKEWVRLVDSVYSFYMPMKEIELIDVVEEKNDEII